MAWADEVADGLNEAYADGAGITFRWRGHDIRALQGSGLSLEQLADGGVLDSENPSFTILKSDMPRGRGFRQGDPITFAGKSLRISSISFDVADPDIRIKTQGDAQ